uniref:SAM-dependent methyltransferase n=1 Tax=Herbidospora sakaeratensis TaxID=564415 RepID=UPI0007C6ABCF|nr:SAM-dependent methyltransferase [Herbidospora sakaeratensis]
MDDQNVLVTLAEIARIAGVGRAAVSNWRRRHSTFPSPVGGSDTSPQFSLPQVEAWLRENDKFRSSSGVLERLWPKYEALGDRERMGRIIAAVGAHVRPDSASQWLTTVGDADQALVEESIALAAGEGGRETFQFLLDRWLNTHIRQVTTTPAPLAELMADMAAQAHPGRISTVCDPACGVGGLLLAGARRWSQGGAPYLVGRERDPVLSLLAATRLALETSSAEIDIKPADALREGIQSPSTTDVILCSPPTNERDWGHEELATDQPWPFGLPPRTESELAWVQRIVSALDDGSVAVVLLPPAVASRRAGRRIRSAMLRAGCLRAVVALPPGAAPPFGISMQLWVLRRSSPDRVGEPVLLVDATDCRATTSSLRGQPVDWDAVRDRVLGAMSGLPTAGSVEIPLLDLLDDETDLTPARHVPTSLAVSAMQVRREWTRFDTGLQAARDLSTTLRDIQADREPLDDLPVAVAELERAGALLLTPGQPVPDDYMRRGERPDGGVPVLTLADVREGQAPQLWMLPDDVERLERDRTITVTSSHDVVLVTPSAEFKVWVDVDAPTVLTSHLTRLRPDTRRLDPWFLAGCLRAHSNARQAASHASTTSRVDPRRLQIPRLPIEEQHRYGDVHRRLVAFEQTVADLSEASTGLSLTLTELLATGRLKQT